MKEESRNNIRAALVQGTGSSSPEPVVYVAYGDVDNPSDLLWEDPTYVALVRDQVEETDRDKAVQEWLSGLYAAQATSVYATKWVTDLGPWESAERAEVLAEEHRARKAARRQAGKKGALTRKQKEEEAKRREREQRYEASMERERRALSKTPKVVEAVEALRAHLGDQEPGSIHLTTFVDKEEAVGIQMFSTETEVSLLVSEVILAGIKALKEKS